MAPSTPSSSSPSGQTPTRIAIVSGPAEMDRARAIEQALAVTIPWSLIEMRASGEGALAGAHVSVVLSPQETIVSSPEQQQALGPNPSPLLVAGVVVGQLGAAKRLAELKNDDLIENAVRKSAAKLIDEQQVETTLAVLVQRALLPAVPTDLHGVEASVLYRPCASLSGDLYDIVKLDEHHLAFFLADACGHGVAAALLTMLIGRLLPMKDSTHHTYRIVPPGEAMARLNAAYVQRQPDSSRLITAIYGVLDLRTGQVTLASAGHPPAAIVGPHGSRLIGDSGPALGMLDDSEYPQVVEKLMPGEAVLLYSDGFEWAFEGTNTDVIGQVNASERRRPNDRYIQAFTDLGARLATMHAEGAMEHIAADMDKQSGSLHQPDDVTLLAVCYRGPTINAAADAPGIGEERERSDVIQVKAA